MIFWGLAGLTFLIGVVVKGALFLPLLLIPAFVFLFECIRHRYKWQPPVAYLGLVMGIVGVSFTSAVIAQSVTGGVLFWMLYALRNSDIRQYAVRRLLFWAEELSWHRSLGLAFIFLYCALFYLPVDGGVSFFDMFHPLYELSVMQSFQQGIFNVPDMSYAGKVLKFHFLGSQIPQYFAWIFHVSALEAIGSHMMVFYFSLYVAVTYFLSKRVSEDVPFWVVFFFPLVGLKSLFYPPTPSILFGGLMMLFSVLFILDKRRWVALGLAGALMLSKASFFPVLFGGAFLRDLVVKRLRVYWTWYGALMALFIGLFVLFFSGAHGHIMWVRFPTTISHYLFHSEGTLPLLYFPFLGLFSWGIWAVKDSSQRLLVALGLSGFLGITLLAEVTSGDHLQFLKGAGAAAVMGAWVSVSAVSFKGRLETVLRYRYVAVMVCVVVLAMPILSRIVDHVVSPKLWLTTDRIEAYTWLSQQEKDGVVLYGPHYQVPNAAFYKKVINGFWYQRTAYERSGISGQQMLVESVKWKGVSTMPDISTRLAMSMQFYLSSVTFSDVSKNRMKLLYSDAFGTHPVVPHSRSDNFGKEWSWHNLQHKIAFEVKEQLRDKSVKTNQELATFLETYDIRYVVLEDGDKPADNLYDLARVVYKNDTHTILEVL